MFGELATALFSVLFGGDGFVKSMFSKHHAVKGQSTSQKCPYTFLKVQSERIWSDVLGTDNTPTSSTF